MAKTKQSENPSIPLYQVIDELTKINKSVAMLKIGVGQLLSVIESGNVENIQRAVEILEIKQLLKKLEPQT